MYPSGVVISLISVLRIGSSLFAFKASSYLRFWALSWMAGSCKMIKACSVE